MDKLNELNLEEMEKVSGGNSDYEEYEVRIEKINTGSCPECQHGLRDIDNLWICPHCKIIWKFE